MSTSRWSPVHVAPWHPGRCAQLLVGDELIGHAGELHPRVVHGVRSAAADSAAAELDLDRLLGSAALVRAPDLSGFPVGKEDVALVVDAAPRRPTSRPRCARAPATLLESLRLFDVYAGEQVGEGQKSLAYALRFRARTGP